MSLDNPGYEKYLKGVLKYTRDGIAFLNKSGGPLMTEHPHSVNWAFDSSKNKCNFKN